MSESHFLSQLLPFLNNCIRQSLHKYIHSSELFTKSMCILVSIYAYTHNNTLLMHVNTHAYDVISGSIKAMEGKICDRSPTGHIIISH